MADEKAKDAKPAPDEKKAPEPTEKKEKALSPDAKKKEKEKKEKAAPEKKIKKVDYGPDFKYIVRIANTDLDGTKNVHLALQGIKGVGPRVAPIVADTAGVPRHEKIGKLNDQQIESLAKTVDNVAQQLPGWAVNHPYDWESGADLHLVGSNVDVLLRDDLNRLKKIRSYRGVRHELGQKVRGQRTRSNGRTGLTVGVSRVKVAEAKAGEEKKEGGEAKPAAPAAGGAKPAAPAAGGKPAAPPAGGKPAAPAGGAKPAAKPPEGGKK